MPPSSPMPTSARIEVFRSGRFTSMEGAPLSYTAADLRAVAQGYDPETAPVPAVVGHPATDAPAYAWVERFEYDEAADRLNAILRDIEPTFAAAVQAGRYRKVSLAFFPPHHPANPAPGTWYPKHVGFLGAAAPAVTGLKNASFAIRAGEAITFEGEFASFGDPGFERSASLFRRIRDFFIAQHGLETADQVLPAYEIEWLDETETSGGQFRQSAMFTATRPEAKKENSVPPDSENVRPDQATFAAREAEIASREAALAERERATRHAGNVSFAEGLVTEGRLLPVSKDKLVAILDAMPDEKTVSFAAGTEARSPAEVLREVLAAQPVVVTFGRLDLRPDAGDAVHASFASDGAAVDPDGLELHRKALAWQSQHPGTAYLDAVRAVS